MVAGAAQAVPWLGMVYEGLKKILEGWMTSPKLATFLICGCGIHGHRRGCGNDGDGRCGGNRPKLINIDWGWLPSWIRRRPAP